MADDVKNDLSADDWAAAMAEQEGDGQKSTAQARAFPELAPGGAGAAASGRLAMVLDIPVQLTVELGRAKIAIRNLLQLAQGSVIELDRLAGEPMGVLVDGWLISQGEFAVAYDKFGIPLTDVISPDERTRRLPR